MKILITNDDSISAAGIEALARAASQLGEVWVVAPAEQCSAMSQKLTLRELLTVEQVSDFPVQVKGAWRVGGTPVDCVKVALDYILEEKPDLVLSGINDGYNVGFDIAYSGTLGAAFEAARSGIPVIAVSVAGYKHLDAVEQELLPVLREILEKQQEPWSVWNVNFPAMNTVGCKGVLWDCPVAPVSLFREKYIPVGEQGGTVFLRNQGIPTPNSRIPEDSDGAAVRKGYIAVSRILCTLQPTAAEHQEVCQG